MYIDMHSHSVASDDSRATVEQYLKWINAQRKKGFQIDGIVLTEHRQFDAESDYSDLAKQYDVVVFKGSELDTRYGHVLVYGVTEQLTNAIPFNDVTMDTHDLLDKAASTGAFGVPAHPGRAGIGLVEWQAKGIEFPDLKVVERVNAGNRPDEQEKAHKVAEELGYLGIGGSDAHFTSGIAKGMTKFPDGIRDEKDLVGALHEGNFHGVLIEETVK
jgi:predicted metal-dependent phosphoesterase TrpH